MKTYTGTSDENLFEKALQNALALAIKESDTMEISYIVTKISGTYAAVEGIYKTLDVEITVNNK